jgi:serine phosphatase RsbU (regulator of sigma subunit)
VHRRKADDVIIDLGAMTLRDHASIGEVREKILGLVRSLSGADVLATRAATAVSEVARRCLNTAEPTAISVSLADDELGLRLQLRLSANGSRVDVAPLRLFFDRIASSESSAGPVISAELVLPPLVRKIDQELIARERARIARKSRAELMEELRAKNRQLELYNESLEATVAERTAALRVANERMQQDLDAGAAYVRALIPPPMQGSVTINWKYVPSSNLGGDTIGYHWIDADHLAMYLIDVTGHGLDSALLAVTITNVIRSQSLPAVDMKRPDQVVAALNQAFQGAQHGLKYFTIWYGVYEPGTRRLTWTGGGHHPAVLLSPRATSSKLLESGGPIVGCMEDMDFPAESCEVPAPARMLLFSDGIFEILRDDELVWNLSDAIAFMSQWSSRDESLTEALYDEVRERRGSIHLDDDFSIIEAFFR